MKKMLSFIVLSLLFLEVNGQESVSFSYDNAGNRVQRTVVLSKSATLNNRGENSSDLTNQPGVFTDIIGSTKVSVFPNPTHGVLKLNFDQSIIEKQATARLYDMRGTVLFRQNISDPLVTLNLESYTNGIYFLEIRTSEAKAVWKIIKN